METVNPGRLSFSQSGVLMSTPDCEKDSLPGLTDILHVSQQEVAQYSQTDHYQPLLPTSDDHF